MYHVDKEAQHQLLGQVLFPLKEGDTGGQLRLVLWERAWARAWSKG